MSSIRIALVCAALIACRPTAGGKCGKDDALRLTCSGASSGLVCTGGHWVDKPCAKGCTKRADPQSGVVDVVVCEDVPHPSLGDPCYLESSMHGMPADESACAPDGTAILGCIVDEGHAGGGTWKITRACPPKTKCPRDGFVACSSE